MKVLGFFIALTISVTAGIIPPNPLPLKNPSMTFMMGLSYEHDIKWEPPIPFTPYRIGFSSVKISVVTGLDQDRNADGSIGNHYIDPRPAISMMYKLPSPTIADHKVPFYLGGAWEAGKQGYFLLAFDWFMGQAGVFEPLALVGFDPKHQNLILGFHWTIKL